MVLGGRLVGVEGFEHHRRAHSEAGGARTIMLVAGHRHPGRGVGGPGCPRRPRDGFRLTAEPEKDDTRGHTDYTARTVNIDPRYALAERVHILVHELGHIRCDHEDRCDFCRGQRETEAESVAFIVCAVLGLQVADLAAIYVGGWSDADPEMITAAQAAIHTAARSLRGCRARRARQPERDYPPQDARSG